MSDDLFSEAEEAVVQALIKEQNDGSKPVPTPRGIENLTGDKPDIPTQITPRVMTTPRTSARGRVLLLDLPPYDGPILMPAERAICGWCTRSHDCGRCSVWMGSPGSDPAKKYNGQIPCIHPCNDEKVAYLRSVYGPSWSPGKEPPKPLHDDDTSSSVAQVIRPMSAATTQEYNVSETNTEDVTVLTPTDDGDDFPTETAPAEPVAESTDDFQEYPVGEGQPTDAYPDAPATEDGNDPVEADPEAAPADPEETPAEEGEPVEADAEKKERGPRTNLEADVKAVTDAYVTEEITVEGDLTPHKVAKLVGERREAAGQPGGTPSSGAVSAVFARWEKYNFAVIQAKPYAFTDYTDAGREHGLSAMKAKHREALKAAKAGDASV